MNILLIEDNPGDAELVRKSFERAKGQYKVNWVTRLSEGIELEGSHSFDVALADLTLPDSKGLETVTALRHAAPQVPVIVLTSLADDILAVRALEEGAQDYLVKDQVSPDVLHHSIRYAVHRHEVVSENARLLEEVRQAKRLLEKKNRRLAKLYSTAQEFVDHVSHEFRTPLSVIKEYAELIRDGVVGDVNDDQQQMLRVIDDRADDLNTMVDDMLDVSKLEAGLLGAWRKECSVEEIVEHVLPALRRKARIRGVTLEIEIDPQLPGVYCDMEKVGRVIVNLAVNAIKFTGKPGTVRLWAHADLVHREVVVGVKDNGVGISPENLAKIFEKFSQIDNDLRTSTKGFGLGLGIAKELVHLNFGEMSVESEPDKGSTFSFTLPMADPREVVARYIKRLGEQRNGGAVVSLLIASVGPSTDRSLADDSDRFLNHLLRRDDLLFRISPRQWLFVVPTPPIEADKFIERTEKERDSANRNRPYAPFPEIQLEHGGSWSVADSPNEILRRVEQHTCTQFLAVSETTW